MDEAGVRKAMAENNKELRNLVMFILAFSGFLRSSELPLIHSRDVQFNEG